MQLVANGADSASITAFIAGPCSHASAGVPGLASALAKHQVTIVSLASAAELGKESVAALQSLIDSLNASPGQPLMHSVHACLQSSHHAGSAPRKLHLKMCQAQTGRLITDWCPLCSGGSASKVVFLDPPAGSLEHWQQLERALEHLERQDTQTSSIASPSSGSGRPAPQTPEVGACQGASSASATPVEQAQQSASQIAEPGSMRGVRQRPRNNQRGREAFMVSLQAEGHFHV